MPFAFNPITGHLDLTIDTSNPEGPVVGPATSVVGDLAVWNNTTGTLLADLATGSNTQVLTVVAGVPAWANASGGGTNWSGNDVSGAFSPAKSNGYFVTGTATGTLPASPSQGDTISFFVDHASQVLTIQATTGKIIRIGTGVSMAGGTATSTLRGTV